MELTAEEKKAIAEQHLKNVLFSEYNIELSLVEENAAAVKDQATIDSLNSQMTAITAKKNALTSELDSIILELE